MSDQESGETKLAFKIMLNTDTQFAARRRRWRLRIIFGVLIAVVACNTHAVEQLALSTEQDFLAEFPSILSATRLAQSRSDAPAAITVIDRKMIEASGVVELAEIFRLVPGFQVGHDLQDLAVSDPVPVTYHGLSDSLAKRLQVLIDGRAVYSPDFGGVRWGELPVVMDDIERIEIIRGPNAAAYGANAFLAVINIITTHPADAGGTFVTLGGGSTNFKRGVFRSGGSRANYDYRLTLGYQSDDGFEGQHDSRSISNMNYRGVYKAGADDTLDFQFGLSWGPHQSGEDLSPEPQRDPERDTDFHSSFQQLRWTHSGVDGDQYLFNFYHNYYLRHDTYIGNHVNPLAPPPTIDALAAYDIDTERFNAEFQHTLSPAKDVRLAWGAEARLDRTKSEGWFNTPYPSWVDNKLVRLFGNAEWRISPKWVANIGTMFENTDIAGFGVSPRLGLNYHINQQNTIRASVSQGQRTPAFFESRATSALIISGPTPIPIYGSDTNVVPEKITSIELGYLVELPKPDLSLDLRLFSDQVVDLIAYPENKSWNAGVDPLYLYKNAGSASVNGYEVELRYRPTSRSQILFSYANTLQHGSWQTAYNGPDVYTATDPSTPRQTAGLLGIYNFPGNFTASVNAYYIDYMSWLATGAETGFTKVDLRLAKKMINRDNETLIEFIAQNLAGSFYDYNSQLVFDRRFFFRISVKGKRSK